MELNQSTIKSINLELEIETATWTENKSSNKCPQPIKKVNSKRKLHQVRRMKCSLKRAPLSSRNPPKRLKMASKSWTMESKSSPHLSNKR